MSEVAAQKRRAFWLKHLHQWHWVSAAIRLVSMLLFAITGITLNHASQNTGQPNLTTLGGDTDVPVWSGPRNERWQITSRKLLNPGSAGSPVFTFAELRSHLEARERHSLSSTCRTPPPAGMASAGRCV
jgi:hypothetical protein